jgi:hypothetical protein
MNLSCPAENRGSPYGQVQRSPEIVGPRVKIEESKNPAQLTFNIAPEILIPNYQIPESRALDNHPNVAKLPCDRGDEGWNEQSLPISSPSSASVHVAEKGTGFFCGADELAARP